MNRTDALVAAIGAGVLVVALAGAALTGTTVSASYAVTWTTSSAEHDLGSDTLQSSGSAEFTYDNPHANTTKLVFAVDVGTMAGHVQADDVHVTVVSPDGAEFTNEASVGGASGGSGTVTVEVPVLATPTVATASGGSSGAAAAQLAAEHTNTTGVGTWTVKVDVNHPSPVPQAHTLAASVEATWYAAEVAPDIPTAR